MAKSLYIQKAESPTRPYSGPTSMLEYESGYQDKEVVYSQATMGEDARGTIASMKASREKREPVDCFLGETVGFPF